MATSHDTAPAGSKYFAFDWKRCAVSPSIDGFAAGAAVAPAPARRNHRSSWRPPGCRWPPVAMQDAVAVDRPLVLRRAAVVRVGRLGRGTCTCRRCRCPSARRTPGTRRRSRTSIQIGRALWIPAAAGESLRDEVEVVGDRDLERRRGEVVHHVVDRSSRRSPGRGSRSRRAGPSAVFSSPAAKKRSGRFGRVESLRRVVQPHAVVQVDDVDAAGPCRSAFSMLGRMPTIHPSTSGFGTWPPAELDRVLPRLDADGSVLEVEVLDAVGRRLRLLRAGVRLAERDREQRRSSRPARRRAARPATS